MNTDNDIQSNDLTQLSSREQLSALMDGALPADQTRFLLRRLQHDAALAESWEHWRIAGEAMRGLAPTRRMPAEFAGKVMAALHAETASAPLSKPVRWWRWGGAAALAASLALIAVLGLQPGHDPQVAAPQVARSNVVTPAPLSPAPPIPRQPLPAQPAATLAEAPAMLAAATAAAVAHPVRRTPRNPKVITAATESVVQQTAVAGQVAALPVANGNKIVSKPWPRSILPQYRGGGDLTVGYGEHVHAPAAMNPFPPQLFAPRAQAPITTEPRQSQP